MDSNNWRAAQGQVPIAGQVMGGEAVAAGGMEGGDWRTQLHQESRQRIVNKIMETLKRHLPFSGQEGPQELKKIAVRFEENIYTAATSQSDYLQRISLKMLTMETESQNPMANAANNNKNPQDPGKTMEILMSNWSEVVESVPEKYIFPVDKRPAKLQFPVMANVPLIDLAQDRPQIVQQILDATQQFGFFQVINHGIPLDDTMTVFKDFFALPPQYKSTFYSNDITKKCRIFSSTLNYDNEDFHYWRDNLTHHCHPLEEHIHLWPQNPTRYREVVGSYAVETRKFLLRILEMISEGLGISSGYLESEVSKIQLVSVNHHIPCPDPRLTLGMPQHTDPNLISMLHQCSVPGLQVFHNGHWMNVEPMPNALVVISGLQLKVISNGRFLSPFHRVMTHKQEARTTIGTFLIPSNEVLIQPAVATHPLYRPFTYKQFFTAFIGNNCEADATLGVFVNELH